MKLTDETVKDARCPEGVKDMLFSMTCCPGSGLGSRKLDRLLPQGVGLANTFSGGKRAAVARYRQGVVRTDTLSLRITPTPKHQKGREKPGLHPIQRKPLAPPSTRLPQLIILLDGRRGGIRCGGV
jgi:hypothetical protein